MEVQHKTTEVDVNNGEATGSSDHQKEEMACIDGETFGLDSLSIAPTMTSIQDLKDVPGLWYRLHVLIRDLRSYQTHSASRGRLEAIIDPSYIGSSYFTSTEATMVKSPQVSGSKGSTTLAEVIEETLTERLERRMKKRVEGGDYRVYAAHDVAPILEKVFGAEEKDVMRDKEFVELVEEWGLQLGEGVVWKGMQKKGRKS